MDETILSLGGNKIRIPKKTIKSLIHQIINTKIGNYVYFELKEDGTVEIKKSE